MEGDSCVETEVRRGGVGRRDGVEDDNIGGGWGLVGGEIYSGGYKDKEVSCAE